MSSITVQLKPYIRNQLRIIHKHMTKELVGVNVSEADAVRTCLVPGMQMYLAKMEKQETEGKAQDDS